jgi:hypothetical protein
MSSTASGASAPTSSPNPKAREVLIVGRSEAVLSEAVARLERKGYLARATNRFDSVLVDFDVRTTDVVVFGGQVPPDIKAALMRDIRVINTGAIFVAGLAGIPGLITAQVEAALCGLPAEAASAGFDRASRAIILSLSESRWVTVTAWWQTSFVPPDPTSDSLVLLDRRLPAGEHSIALPIGVPERSAFASVRIDLVVQAFSVSVESAAP